MAALLSSRTALVARSTSISTGAIVGATIGAAIGALLLIVCALPFILRARRLRAFRRQHGEHADVEEIGQFPGAPDFLSRSTFGDAFRRLSHGPATQTPPKTCPSGDGQESTDQNQEPAEKPHPTLYPTGVSVHYGLPSPVSPPSLPSPPPPAATKFEPLPGKSIQDGRTATGSLTLATQTTQDSIPAQMLSREPTITDAGTSFFSSSRQGTFESKDFTEEPESITQGRSQGGKGHHRRKSSHISESVRHLARMASATVRRNSTMSTGSLRSPPVSPSDGLPHLASAPATFEPVDTEARGEAYSYYHGFDDVPPSAPAPVSEHAASYGPPISIPRASAAPMTAFTFTSPTSASTVTPISPVSLDGRDNVYDEPSDFREPPPRDKRGLFQAPQRMNTQPPQPIVADLHSPPLPSKPDVSVNPMDIMPPMTDGERAWKVQQDLVKLSTPTPSPPTRTEQTPPMEDFASQATPEPTPDPGIDRELEMEMMPEPEPEPQIKRETEHQILMPPPEIVFNGGDIGMVDETAWSTPPPSSITSTQTTPNYTPESRPTPGPYIATPSPRSNEGPSDKPDASPRLYKCDDCERVFDQYHKLNHHTRYHDRPHICTHEGCGKRFGTKTHLDRHVNDKHTKTKKYFCTQYNCPYSRQGGKSFPRKDNWRRHMINKHSISNPPEPAVEYCDEVIMGNTD